MKIFEFNHSEGSEILAANYAKEAILYYFTKYQDDYDIDDITKYGGIEIKELDSSEITKKQLVYNEETNSRVEVSYKELADESFNENVAVLVTPNY